MLIGRKVHMKILEGKIIKFYREMKQLRQKDIVHGVCSTTHISKIERGQTEVSSDIIEILSTRLGINMQEEIEYYTLLENILKEWHEAIILSFNSKVEQLKAKLEKIPLLQLHEFYRSYTLILTRYYLWTGEGDAAASLIKKMEKWANPTPYDENMLLHMKGIFCLRFKDENYKAISLLKAIDVNVYNHPEYNYDLAVAYHSIKSRVSSYYHANKALLFFKDAQSFSRVIDTEMLMLIQLEQDDFYDAKDMEYKRLLEAVNNYGLHKQRSMLLHNYAYHQLRRGHITVACIYYKEALETKEADTPGYLGSLEGYLHALTIEGKTPLNELIPMAEKGLSLAKELVETIYIHLFKLHLYKLQKKNHAYFHYLEIKAYPYFTKSGHVFLAEHYNMKLYKYYMEKDDIEKANEYAAHIVSQTYKDYTFV